MVRRSSKSKSRYSSRYSSGSYSSPRSRSSSYSSPRSRSSSYSSPRYSSSSRSSTHSNGYDSYGFRTTPKKESPQPKPDSTNMADRAKAHTSKFKKAMYIVGFIVVVVAAFLSGFIAWNCYANDLHIIRLLKTCVAFTFGIPYLGYFILLRVILQVPCF
jgi:hypothetical protein